MFACGTLALLFAAPASASVNGVLVKAEARHLLTRTGFDPTSTRLQSFTGMRRTHAVDTLLGSLRTEPATAPPAWIDEPPVDLRKLRKASVKERMALRKQLRQKGFALQGWWLREMTVTESPLTERMTLFWHNHFTSALSKVRTPVLMYRQNAIFRRLGTANFADLLRAVLRDPAMLVYLDNHRNNKRKPNENLARELLELFTLGEGHYTEADIRAAARALTGHGVDRRTGTYRFRARQHDRGEKTFLGVTGALDADAVIATLLREPQTARYLSAKLWQEFAGGSAPDELLTTLAETLRKHDYAIKPWLRTLLLSPDFFSRNKFGSKVKSPVEFVVGLVRMFDVPVNDPRQLARATRRLGQEVFNPPNVKGWPGGNNWLSADTMIVRQHVVGRFLRGVPMATGMQGAGGKMQRNKMRGNKARQREILVGWVNALPHGQQSLVGIASVLLAVPPVGEIDNEGLTSVERVESLIFDPVFQLK
jgi:uncharacterized protein (DUF1800 family)